MSRRSCDRRGQSDLELNLTIVDDAGSAVATTQATYQLASAQINQLATGRVSLTDQTTTSGQSAWAAAVIRSAPPTNSDRDNATPNPASRTNNNAEAPSELTGRKAHGTTPGSLPLSSSVLRWRTSWTCCCRGYYLHRRRQAASGHPDRATKAIPAAVV